MKTVKFLSLTLLLSVFCAGMTLAQQPGPRSGKVKATPEERGAKHVERMEKSLELTPEQVAKLRDLHSQFAKDREQDRVAAKENRQDMKAKMDAYDAQLKSILTPEQYQKYQDQRKNMKRGEGKHGKGNNNGDHQGKWDKEKKKPLTNGDNQ